MNNEPNKPIPAQELTEKELEGVVGGSNSSSFAIKRDESPVSSQLVDTPDISRK